MDPIAEDWGSELALTRRNKDAALAPRPGKTILRVEVARSSRTVLGTHRLSWARHTPGHGLVEFTCSN